MAARRASLSLLRPLLMPLILLRRLIVRLLILLRLSSPVKVEHCEAGQSAVIGHDRSTKRKVSLADVLRSCPSLCGPDATYTPPFFLVSGHLTTIFAAMANFLTINVLEYERHFLSLPDGGTIGLDWTPPLKKPERQLSDRTPIIVCIHGLTGGSHESYVRAVLADATKSVEQGGRGWRGVVFNYRGCSGVPVTSKRFYHGGWTEDVRAGLLYVQSLFPDAPIVGVGFSLGANVITKYLGEEGDSTPLRAAVALSNPWHFFDGHIALMSSYLGTVYSKAMAKNLRTVLAKHKHHFQSSEFPGLNLDCVYSNPHQTLYEFDASVTRILGGFDSAEHYYTTQSSHQFVGGVRRPLLGFNAANDPITAFSCAPHADAKRHPYFALASTRHGGHLGWFSFFTPRQRWVVRPTLEFLATILSTEPIDSLPRRRTGVKEGFTIDAERPHIGFKVVEASELITALDADPSEASAGMLKGL